MQKSWLRKNYLRKFAKSMWGLAQHKIGNHILHWSQKRNQNTCPAAFYELLKYKQLNGNMQSEMGGRIEKYGATKRGTNKELESIGVMLNAAVKGGLIPENPVARRIEKFRTERRLPRVLSSQEVEKLKTVFKGQLKLAFYLFVYTGARRGEICQFHIGDGRGLRWKDVDWMKNQIRLMGKGKERFTPMVEPLRKLLAVENRKRQEANTLHPDDLVVHYTCHTITREFRKALKQIGAYTKGSAVHVLRHTAATAILEATGDIRVTQEILGHSQITTTQLYTHIVGNRKREALEALPY